MSKRFLISDTHFYHDKIILYENRPFTNVEEMNEGLIENWNSTVSKKDTVFFLGDFCFGGVEKSTEIFKRLKGNIIMVQGNHDSGSVDKWLKVGFKEVYKYPIIVDGFFILSHKPLYINDAMPYVNIHGHTHSKSYDHKQYVNVSVELHDYKPVLFDDIKNMFAEDDRDVKPKKPEILGDGDYDR